MSGRKRNPGRWTRYSVAASLARERAAVALRDQYDVDPLRFVPDHSEVFEVAIDHWIAWGGEHDPALGILMGDDWWMYPWSLFPREPTCRLLVPVRGRISHLSYQITRDADVPAVILWRRSWTGHSGREHHGFWLQCNGATSRTWPTGTTPSGVAKLARRIQRDPDRFVKWGDAAPVRLWRRHALPTYDHAGPIKTSTLTPIHPDDWP